MIKHPITGIEIPENWQLMKIDELKSTERYSCVAGPFGSDISSQYFEDFGVPVIRGNNLSVNNEKFIPKGFVFVSEDRASKYKAQHVKANDLVFTCWGTIGQVGIIPENGPFNEYIISNKQLKLRVNEELVNPHFLYYYFSSQTVFSYINNIAIGSAVPGINLGILKKFPVAIPKKSSQDFIVNLLDNFHDLIENNRQRIKLLEETAEEIYKEWFVRLRFPGYETAKFHDEEGGRSLPGSIMSIPDNWHYGTIGTLYNVKSGFAFQSEHFGTVGSPIIKIKNIDNLEVDTINCDRYCGEINNRIKKFELAGGDLLVAMTGATIGKVALFKTQKEAYYLNQRVGKFFVKNEWLNNQAFIYQFAKSNEFKDCINNFALGAAQPNISGEQIENIKLLIPDKKHLLLFSEIAGKIIEEIFVLKDKNQVLQQTRDLLLPRLISGKLSVEHLIKEIERLTMVIEEQI